MPKSNSLPFKQRCFLITSVIYILYIIVPIIDDLVHLPVGTINIIASVIIIALYPKAMNNRAMFWFLCYGFVLLAYLLVGKELPSLCIGDYESSRIFIIEMAFILPNIAIFSVLNYLKDVTLFNRLAKISFWAIVGTFIFLTPIILANPMILRSTVEKGWGYENIIGIPFYTLVHAYVLVIPGILLLYKYATGKRKFLMFVILVLFLFIIVQSNITTIILFTLAAIIFSIIYSAKNTAKAIVLTLLVSLILLLLYVTRVIESVLDSAMLFYENTPTYVKMMEFKQMLYGGGSSEGITAGRAYLHGISWRAFGNNVLFGSLPLGDHSSILDRLGGLGLFGFIPFILMVWNIIKTNLRNFIYDCPRAYYKLMVVLFVVLMYEKGLIGVEGWLFFMVIAPSLLVMVSNKYYS